MKNTEQLENRRSHKIHFRPTGSKNIVGGGGKHRCESGKKGFGK